MGEGRHPILFTGVLRERPPAVEGRHGTYALTEIAGDNDD